MPFNKINDSQRAAVIAGLLVGKMASEIAQETGVSEPTVGRIKRKLPEELVKKMEAERKALEAERAEFELEKKSIIHLVSQHLVASLDAGISLLEQASDAEWRNRQNAAQLAILYGVVSDRAINILGAMQRAELRMEAEHSQNNPSAPQARPPKVS
ncbi:MAG: hypothetical protein M3362_02020 [Acidobacteriota bacterium]|nr:hypothetical protein [Acidobacteriota bacterium]